MGAKPKICRWCMVNENPQGMIGGKPCGCPCHRYGVKIRQVKAERKARGRSTENPGRKGRDVEKLPEIEKLSEFVSMGEYKGNRLLVFGSGKKFPFGFGAGKAALLLAALDEMGAPAFHDMIRKFVEENRKDGNRSAKSKNSPRPRPKDGGEKEEADEAA